MIRSVSAIILLSSLAVFAQETESTSLENLTNETSTSAEDAVSDAKKDVERIEVTGSHIKRVDVEGASPVQVLDRKALDKSGYNSVADVLRETSANSFGSVREDSGSNAAGVAHVNLRGLGSTNTLVLLNGVRMPADAVTGAVDLNLIPMAAVERIEMLKDGASAIYGSDALGGVVNIITRKDFQDSEINLTRMQPEGKGGAKQEISLVNGVNGEKTSMVNVVHYRQNEVIFSRDREWSKNGMSLIGGPGSYRTSSGAWAADPSCPAGQLETTPQGTFCSFKHTDYSTELPALQQFSLFSETNYELNGRVRLKGRIGATQRKAQWSYAPAPGQFKIAGSQVGTAGPGGTLPPGATAGQDLTVRYRLVDLGTRDTEVTTYSYNGLLGGTIDIGKGWEVDVSTGYSGIHNRDVGVNGYALTKDIEDAIREGRFRPLDPTNKGSIENTRFKPEENMLSLLSTADVKATGEIAELEAGAVALAIGSGITFQRFEDNADDATVNNEVFGTAGSKGAGQRNTAALFSEVSVPLAKKLELQVAARYDSYSDFGSSTNPKVAALYRPNPDLLFRASAGTGFKAPRMQDLYAAASLSYETFIDKVSCEREKAAGGETPSCLPSQYEVTSGGNSGLKEERSISYNLGAVFEPNKNFGIGADLFLTKQNNVVGISYQSMADAEAKGINVAEKGVTIRRDAQGYIETINAPIQNLTSQEIYGLDVSTAYRFSKFRISSDHSHMFYFKQEGFPGAGVKDEIGTNGAPAWRNTTGLSYIPSDKHDLNLSAITVAEHEKAVPEMGKLGQFTSFDLSYSYDSQSWGTVSAGMKNVFAANPPLDDSNINQQLMVDLYDQIGRVVYAGYKTTF